MHEYRTYQEEATAVAERLERIAHVLEVQTRIIAVGGSTIRSDAARKKINDLLEKL